MLNHHIQGDDKLLSSLKKVTDSSTQSAIMADIAAHLLFTTQERFENEEDPEGNKWPQSRRAKDTGGKTLSNKGHLRNSFTTSSSAKHAEVGTNDIRAAIHQHGGIIRPKNKDALYFNIGGHLIRVKKVVMPARPMVGLSDENREEIPLIIKDHWEGPFA